MSRQKQEKLTDQEIVDRYKPKVFGIYAKNYLDRIAGEDKDIDPCRIQEYRIHNNGTSVKRIIRVLYENDIFTWMRGSSPRINLSSFNKEAPSFSNLNTSDFNLDTEDLFLKVLKRTNSGEKFNQESLSALGGKKVYDLSTPTAIWAYFNQDRIYVKKSGKYDHSFVYLKDSQSEVTRHKLLNVLFEELKCHPTKYLAGFSGTKWVGHVSTMPYIRKHDATSIVKSGIYQVVRAEIEIRNHANHFLAYANMLKCIKLNLRGDREERVTSFLKYMINAMLKKAPLKCSEFNYRTILENASEFTFENLFPNGLTKDQIKVVLGKM